MMENITLTGKNKSFCLIPDSRPHKIKYLLHIEGITRIYDYECDAKWERLVAMREGKSAYIEKKILHYETTMEEYYKVLQMEKMEDIALIKENSEKFIGDILNAKHFWKDFPNNLEQLADLKNIITACNLLLNKL